MITRDREAGDPLVITAATVITVPRQNPGVCVVTTDGDTTYDITDSDTVTTTPLDGMAGSRAGRQLSRGAQNLHGNHRHWDDHPAEHAGRHGRSCVRWHSLPTSPGQKTSLFVSTCTQSEPLPLQTCPMAFFEAHTPRRKPGS